MNKNTTHSGCLFDLTNKVAIVTGAGRGLGAAMAVGLAKAGATVVITDVLPTGTTVASIVNSGGQAEGFSLDVSKKSEVTTVITEIVKKYGKIDILVNNAGIEKGAPTETLSEKDFDRVIEVNLKGEFLVAQAVGIEMLKKKSGSIINVASVAGFLGSAGGVAYNSSKAGIINLTRSLAVEWAKSGIRVNAICPGIFETEMTKPYLAMEQYAAAFKARVPMGRVAKPEELAGIAVFLASEKASGYLTGQLLIVDGAWTASLL
jgi:gluconate 5-dehydrogenase